MRSETRALGPEPSCGLCRSRTDGQPCDVHRRTPLQRRIDRYIEDQLWREKQLRAEDRVELP
jgi:hypothetical protein